MLRTFLYLSFGPLLFAGCSSLSGEVAYDYSVVIYNTTLSEIREINVYYGGFNSGGGPQLPNGRASYAFVPLPVPEKANVTWLDAADKRHDVLVQVLKSLPPKEVWDLDFNVVFCVLDGERVSVLYELEKVPDSWKGKHLNAKFLNATPDQIHHVVAKYGAYECIGGILDPENSSDEQFLPLPMPETADISWIDEGGVAHAVRVDLRKKLAPRPKRSMTIIFTIEKNGSVSAGFQSEPP